MPGPRAPCVTGWHRAQLTSGCENILPREEGENVRGVRRD